MKLYPFQEVGRDYLAMRDRAVLCDQQGLGKTVQALAALPRAAPVLVVCPRIVRSVWVDHVARFRPDYRATEITKRADFRWPGVGEVAIVNFDILPGRPTLPPSNTYLVADESHYAKSPTSLRGTRLRRMAGLCLAGGGRVWAMTGTPQPNEPPDLWWVMQTAGLANEAWGSWENFRRLYNAVDKDIVVRRGRRDVRIRKTYWGSPLPQVAEGFRRIALRRTRTEVLPDLPHKHYRTLRVNCLNAEATKLCDKAMAALRSESLDPEGALLRLVGMSEPPDIAAARKCLSGLKVRACGDLLDVMESQGQVVVYSAHRAPVQAIAIRPGWGILMGGMSEEVRAGVIADFQAGKLRGIAATIGAAREGITLTAAHEVVFLDRAWVPAWNEQAEDRVCRIGQEHQAGVGITIIQAEHDLDMILNRVLVRKQTRIEGAVGAAS